MADPRPRGRRDRRGRARHPLTAFLVVAVVVIVAPGPDFALTLRNAVSGARGLATAAAAGVVTGQLAWALAASGGVAAVLVASRPAFETLRFAGAAYLVWLGVATLVGQRRPERAAARAGSPYRQGLVSNLSNPKMPIFFTSLLPEFGASFAVLALHGVIFAALTFAWLAAVARAGAALRVPAVRRALDVVTGVVLVAFGLRLTTERR